MGGITDTIKKVVTPVTDVVKQIPVIGSTAGGLIDTAMGATGLFTGNGSDPGILGTGQYKVGDSGFKPGQESLQQYLENRVAGRSASPAELQLKQAGETAMSQAASQAASTRGVSDAGLVARNLSRQQEGIQRGLLQTGAQLKANEQVNAEQNLINLLGGARGQDISGQAIQAQSYDNSAKNTQGIVKPLLGGVSNMLGAGSSGGDLLGGFLADGGIVPGGYSPVDNKIMGLRSGEMVLDPEQQKGLFDFIQMHAGMPTMQDYTISDGKMTAPQQMTNYSSGFDNFLAANEEMLNHIDMLKKASKAANSKDKKKG